MTALLGVAHGTRNPEGAQTVGDLMDLVREMRPWLAAEEAFAEISAPSILSGVRRVGAGPIVAVPLLLGRGYHVHVDIPKQLAEAGANAVVSRPLGPHSLLTAVLLERLGDGADADAVVLGAAGSTDPAGMSDVHDAARLLGRRLRRPVACGFVGGPGPELGEVVDRLRAQGARSVAVASYLLAPGFFHGRMTRAGADLVSEPLGVHEHIARLVLRRYDEALVAARVA